MISSGRTERLLKINSSINRAVPGNTILMRPQAGASIPTEALLETFTGLQTSKSVQRKGGAARSHAKAQAARANGAKGGRPRKSPPT